MALSVYTHTRIYVLYDVLCTLMCLVQLSLESTKKTILYCTILYSHSHLSYIYTRTHNSRLERYTHTQWDGASEIGIQFWHSRQKRSELCRLTPTQERPPARCEPEERPPARPLRTRSSQSQLSRVPIRDAQRVHVADAHEFAALHSLSRFSLYGTALT